MKDELPDPQDQVAPFLGRELERRWWRNARTMRNQLRRQAPVADASHLVALPAVVADHLCPGSGICWVMVIRKSVGICLKPKTEGNPNLTQRRKDCREFFFSAFLRVPLRLCVKSGFSSIGFERCSLGTGEP